MQYLAFFRTTKNFYTKFLTFIGCACFISTKGQQPFRYDNVLYKAVYWNDAVRLMNENKNYLIVDVRSRGEFADSSQYTHMNMGRVKGAVNINIDSFPKHIADLKKDINKSIFIYCSHSQRSRRVSKLLADSGFKNVYNINGGMSVANESGLQHFPFKTSLIVDSKPYTNIASTEALNILENPDLVIIDIRSTTEFNSKDTVFNKNLGHIRNAINIPAGQFRHMVNGLHIPREKSILVYDLNGSTSTDVAIEAVKMGYKRVFNLFEGLEGLLCDNTATYTAVNKVVENPPPFKIISVKECINLLSGPNDFTVIDARPVEEFNNRSAKEYLNTGRLKNAINIPSTAALETVTNTVHKDANILIYGSYSNDKDVDICKALIDKGFTNVYLLYQGIGRFTWACFNIENCKEGVSLLTNHAGLY